MKRFLIHVSTYWCGMDNTFRAEAESELELDEIADQLRITVLELIARRKSMKIISKASTMFNSSLKTIISVSRCGEMRV